MKKLSKQRILVYAGQCAHGLKDRKPEAFENTSWADLSAAISSSIQMALAKDHIGIGEKFEFENDVKEKIKREDFIWE